MTYINTIKTGLMVFPFIAALITFPYALYQYNKHGAVSKYRTLIIYSFWLYMLIAFFMVSLPLPSRESTVGNRIKDHLNLIPFRQVWLYWRNRQINRTTIRAYLTSMSLWQLLFNILLTLPFGVYMHYYFKKSFLRTVKLSFLLSLFYETSQITALFGIYPGPYRLADVEDLICNTMGGVLGYHVAYLFAVFLPKREEIDAYCREAGKQVSGKRRFWAVLFDYVCCNVVFLFLLGGLTIVFPGVAKYESQIRAQFWSFFCIFSLIQVLLTKGSTMGHAICRMSLVSKDKGTASAGQLVKRYFFLWLFTGPPLMLVDFFASGRFKFINGLALLGILIALRTYYFLYFFKEICSKKGKPMPHDKLSGTMYMAIERAKN